MMHLYIMYNTLEQRAHADNLCVIVYKNIDCHFHTSMRFYNLFSFLSTCKMSQEKIKPRVNDRWSNH